jgi:SAM-dependent methyltransferase
MMELSHAVDGIAWRNLSGFKNVDIIQCSIDAPPLRDQSIDGIVYCHNVIHHTPSVEATARALWALVAPGGEFVFNCYGLNDQGILRWVRFHVIYRGLRGFLSRMPFQVILAYARLMAAARLIPGLGWLLEKVGFCVQGDVPRIPCEPVLGRIRRRFKLSTLNTFDAFGSHSYQHHKSDEEIHALLRELQPDTSKILNMDKYFSRPQPIGCALRVIR